MLKRLGIILARILSAVALIFVIIPIGRTIDSIGNSLYTSLENHSINPVWGYTQLLGTVIVTGILGITTLVLLCWIATGKLPLFVRQFPNQSRTS